MLRKLGVDDTNYRYYVSQFENGQREPTLLLLFEYAKAAGVCMDVLVDDKQDLPMKLPSKAKHHR